MKNKIAVPQATLGGNMSPEQICRSVAADFKLRGISHADAAEKLGVNIRSVSNQISGKRPFGKKSAQKYAAAFGYEEPFLLYGAGKLKKGPKENLVAVEVKPESPLDKSTVMILLDRISDLEKSLQKLKEENEALRNIQITVKKKK